MPGARGFSSNRIVGRPTLSAATILGFGLVGLFAGLLGALVGIGGGILIIPALVLGFGIDIKLAVAASLVAVVATSTAAGSVYVGKGLSNMRLGMTLEIATTIGGISGGLLAMYIPSHVLAGVFSIIVVVTAVLMLRGKDSHGKPRASTSADQDGSTEPLESGNEEMGRLAGSYYDPYHRKVIQYEAVNLPFGAAISFVAGILSGMLGVGGGFMKVPAMNLGMRVPIKVAAATSNFMIGVTAISSLFVYFARGLVHPFLAAPISIGVVFGALGGTLVAHRVSPGILRTILAVVLLFVAVQMAMKSLDISWIGAGHAAG